MNLLMNLIVAVQIISALVMIGLVLIQHGKGADMGASFGSGASGSLFGATGSANFLSRSTAVCAAVFFACTLTLAFFANDRGVRAGGGGSVLQGAGVAAPAASVPATGAALVPGAAGSAAAPAAVVPAPAPAASSGAGAVPSK
ncbi:preprotein translocase subunit SecG [Piscinibacter sp.]|uniref:preprotein translocase subunit SecG n=1 Tax=Piscinibacter sp. TaxID=1903157 RepID=UPI001B4C2B26|nr:preprotein translocase subunit SecG [Piscinibacter sp.]MBK7531671.1 preprotein translocase subunit SecG [Piscinibacter sp.]MBP6542513.1 preprotein translocase subunit SecG [Piscinibacter sp.]